MLQRSYPRIPSNLSVWVTGTDLNGNRFKQTAKVIEVSRLGGRLTEIRCLRAPGEIVEVKHRGKRAHFRVVWMDILSGQVGIRCVELDPYIWGLRLPLLRISSAASTPMLNSAATGNEQSQNEEDRGAQRAKAG
jgi:hypothetical protein